MSYGLRASRPCRTQAEPDSDWNPHESREYHQDDDSEQGYEPEQDSFRQIGPVQFGGGESEGLPATPTN